MPNRLAQETSPYLLQHKDNPVDWYAWGPEALNAARERNVPILLSIGYSSCHWCHVMAHQSFENEAIARQMNEHFVCIKVDREERPDIDAIYMTALQALTGHGGWPLNIFLTPGGTPFFGGTYWPPVDQGGMPGFPRVLEAVSNQWQRNRDAIDRAASQVLEVLVQSTASLPDSRSNLDTTPEVALLNLAQRADPECGGFGGAPKFPQASIETFLLRHFHRTGSQQALQLAMDMLDAMARGGIYDQLGGGFSRYSVDAEWLVPHFEKMLYDNAQLLQIYLDAWRITASPRYRTVAIETSDWLLREMQHPAGGFYSALDADSEGEEGAFYVWTDHEIDEILPAEDADLARLHFGITPGGNFERRNVLSIVRSAEQLASSTGRTVAEVDSDLIRVRHAMVAARNTRERPGTDTKIVVGWNGLAFGALAETGGALGRSDFLRAAERAADRIIVSGFHADGRLARTVSDNCPTGYGLLEDHAFLAHGFLQLHAVTGDPRWLLSARNLAEAALDHFVADIGFWDTADYQERLVVRPRDLQDGATPSGNSMMLDVLLQLHDLTLDERYLAPVQPLLERFASAMAEHPAAFGNLLAVVERFLADHRQLVLAGGHDARALGDVVFERFEPFLSVGWASSSFDPAAWPLLANPTLPGDATGAAFLCQGMACLPPVFDPAALATLLDSASPGSEPTV